MCRQRIHGFGKDTIPETDSSHLPGGRVPKTIDHLLNPSVSGADSKKKRSWKKINCRVEGAGISHAFITKKLASAWSAINLPLLFVTGSPKVRSRSCHGQLSGSNVEIGWNFVAKDGWRQDVHPSPREKPGPPNGYRLSFLFGQAWLHHVSGGCFEWPSLARETTSWVGHRVGGRLFGGSYIWSSKI